MTGRFAERFGSVKTDENRKSDVDSVFGALRHDHAAKRIRPAEIWWPGLAALGACLLWMFIDWGTLALPPPFEDAAMLFKYAENFGHGNGITWNAGQDSGRTDGATDLGFVLALAPFVTIGVPAAVAAIFINLGAVFGIGTLLGAINNRLWHQPAWVPLAASVLVASGPTSRYVLSGYSPPVLAFALLGAFALAVSSAVVENERRLLVLIAAAGAAAGLCGWWRPEGFAFGPLVVLAALIVASRVRRRSLFTIPTATAIFTPYVLLALAWVVFRLLYFGQLLPTSAVMKGGSLHGENALYSVQFYGSLLLPIMGALLVYSTGTTRPRNWWISAAVLAATLIWINAAVPPSIWMQHGLGFVPPLSNIATLLIFIPVVILLAVAGVRSKSTSWAFPVMLTIFSLAWVAIATTLNHWGRMQWPLVPVLASIGVASVVSLVNDGCLIPEKKRRPTRVAVSALIFLLVVGLGPFAISGDYREYVKFYDFHLAVATALKRVDTSQLRLATTEAGLIPLAITGPSLDTWGHNNRAIAASHGRNLESELAAFAPNILTVHGIPPESVYTPQCPNPRDGASSALYGEEWSRMVTAMYDYAYQRGFELVRISETGPCQAWSVWMSPDVDWRIYNVISEISMPGTELEARKPPKE